MTPWEVAGAELDMLLQAIVTAMEDAEWDVVESSWQVATYLNWPFVRQRLIDGST